MKEKIIIFLLLIIFILISILFFKNREPINKTFQETKYSFYKENLKDVYKEYQKQNNLSEKDAIIRVNIGLNKPFYTDTKAASKLDTFHVLVNKYRYLPSNYVPSNMVKTSKNAKASLYLNRVAYENFLQMANDAYQEDHFKLRITSAYRSYNYQENLYQNYLKYDSKDIVDTYSSRPGYSEHQTGLAIDIDNEILDYNRFHLTMEFTWMQNNAYKYGFILRYPLGKEKITGYKYEPWHYRYVGNDIAKYLHDNDLTFDEYYMEFLDN